MSKSGRKVRIFSALEVANICGVVNQTAINWIRNGHLKAFTTPGGQYRIYTKDLAAFLDKRGMNASGEVLHVMMENANWNSLLIAMEYSANEDLKNRLGSYFNDFNIIQACNWFEVGRKMTEEKPGFILLDAGLSGVDISWFIKTVKEDPSFGKPFVFLLLDEYGSNIETKVDMILTKPLDVATFEAAVKEFEKQFPAASIA